VEARAAIRVDRSGGVTRLVELRSDPPLTVRSTPDPTRPGDACVHLVGSGAAPLGGDQLHLDVEVGEGASLRVGAVAAALAQPDPAGRGSRSTVDVRVGRDACLMWTGQPIVAVRGCSHHTVTNVLLAPGSSLVWREQLVTGRHDERTGSVAQTLSVDVEVEGGGSMPLLRSSMALGPAWPGSLGPGGVGSGNRSVGTVLVAGAGAGAASEAWGALVASTAGSAVRPAVLPLDGAGVLRQAVSPEAGAVVSFLDAATDVVTHHR
jgi:urease accessory protein